MDSETTDLNLKIGARVHELRTKRGQTLKTLAEISGVSRSMISLIERGECSPTASVLEKLAGSLAVPLPSLFETGDAGTDEPCSPVSKVADRLRWQDPESGYVRTIVSPQGIPQPMQILEIRFPAGKQVAFDPVSVGDPVYQQIWVLRGKMNITAGSEFFELRQGDCLAKLFDLPTVFKNPTQKESRYAVVISRKF